MTSTERLEASQAIAWRRYLRPGLLLLVTGVSLYLLLPSLIAVSSSWRSLSHLTSSVAVIRSRQTAGFPHGVRALSDS